MLRKHKRLTKKELKKDPLLIFIAQAVDYIRDEWIKIGSTVLVVVLIISASFLFVNGRRKGAINAYDAAMTALANNAPEAKDLLQRVVNDYSGSDLAGDALMQLANSAFKDKDYDTAEKYFKRYIDKFGQDPVYLFNAYNGLGSIYEERKDYEKAGELYTRFAAKNKDSVFLPVMLLNAGKAYMLAGNKDKARQQFTKITEEYSDSREKQEADYFLGMLN